MYEHAYLTVTRTLAGSLCLSVTAFASAAAQQIQVDQSTTTPARVVPLVTGTCPVVQNGELISLDWNPGFEPISAITGLNGFRLSFKAMTKDDTAAGPQIRLVELRTEGRRISYTGNGYFHIELPLAFHMALGTYQLFAASAIPAVPEGYRGEQPQMTATPVREHFCITVVAPPASTSSPTT